MKQRKEVWRSAYISVIKFMQTYILHILSRPFHNNNICATGPELYKPLSEWPYWFASAKSVVVTRDRAIGEMSQYRIIFESKISRRQIVSRRRKKCTGCNHYVAYRDFLRWCSTCGARCRRIWYVYGLRNCGIPLSNPKVSSCDNLGSNNYFLHMCPFLSSSCMRYVFFFYAY